MADMNREFTPGAGSSGAGAGRAFERPASPVNETLRTPVEIVKDIVGNIQEIIRSEIRLGRAELGEKAAHVRTSAIVLGAGAVIALYGLAFLLVCVYNALNYVIAPWLSSLAIGVVLGVVGGGLLMAGRTMLKKVNPTPVRTVQSVKEDAEWLKNRTR